MEVETKKGKSTGAGSMGQGECVIPTRAQGVYQTWTEQAVLKAALRSPTVTKRMGFNAHVGLGDPGPQDWEKFGHS